MRRLALVNSRGEYLDITTQQFFMHDLSGFGYECDDTYKRAGSRWVRVEQKLRQSTICGKIAFNNPNTYTKYNEFIKFCSLIPLTLEYTPEDVTYSRDVVLNKIDKGEAEKTGILICSVEFMPLTPWYRRKYVTIEPTIDEGSGWEWDVTWDITWGQEKVMNLVIDSDSTMDSPVKLTIYGPIENPSWKHYANGSLISTGNVTCTVPAGDRLVIDNTKDPYKIIIYDEMDEVIEDVYQKSDFSTEMFIYFQNGRNSIQINSKTDEMTTIIAEAMIYYESV